MSKVSPCQLESYQEYYGKFGLDKIVVRNQQEVEQCPHCNSYNMEDLSHLFNDHDYVCNDCGHRWV